MGPLERKLPRLYTIFKQVLPQATKREMQGHNKEL
jgi:hypothetical protein